MNILELYGERIAVNSVKPNTMIKTHGASQCWCYRPCQGVITSKLEERGGLTEVSKPLGILPSRTAPLRQFRTDHFTDSIPVRAPV